MASGDIPRITFNEGYIDLRNCSGRLHKKHNGSTKFKHSTPPLNITMEDTQKNRTVNFALKKLVSSYHNKKEAIEKNNPKLKIKNHTAYNPRKEKAPECHYSNLRRSKSVTSTASKAESSKTPSSPDILRHREKNEPISQTAAPITSKCTRTTIKDIKDIKRKASPERSKAPGTLIYSTNPQWKDQRLIEKYSVLKLPWKRSYTLPVYSKPSKIVRSQEPINSATKSVAKTYLYDEGSELDSSCLQTVRKQFLINENENQALSLLFIGGTTCGIFLVSSLIWFISGSDLLHEIFEMKKPQQESFTYYIKYLGGGIIFILTTLIRTLGRIFILPIF